MVDREEAYLRLVALFMQGPEEVRDLIRAKWDFGAKWIYPNPQRLACLKNEKYSCVQRVLASLVYDAIENLKNEDSREKLVVWAVVYHSCIAAGLIPQELFKRVASVSSQEIARLMTDFIGRRIEDKSMEAFMLISKTNSDGETEILPSWHK